MGGVPGEDVSPESLATVAGVWVTCASLLKSTREFRSVVATGLRCLFFRTSCGPGEDRVLQVRKRKVLKNDLVDRRRWLHRGHVCIALLDAGLDVVAVDNLSNSNKASLERVQSICGRSLSFDTSTSGMKRPSTRYFVPAE